MSMVAMSCRLLPALGVLALLLVAVIGCGGDGPVDAVPSGEEASHVRASSPVSEDAASLPPAIPAAASESFQALPPSSREFFSAGPVEESAATARTLPAEPYSGDIASWEPRDVESFDLFSGSGGQAAGYPIDGTASVEEVLEEGLRSAGASTRCTSRSVGRRPGSRSVRSATGAASRGRVRTPGQRALAIRYRLGWLEEDEAISPSCTAYLELLFNATLVTRNVSDYVRRSPIRAVDPREALSRTCCDARSIAGGAQLAGRR